MTRASTSGRWASRPSVRPASRSLRLLCTHLLCACRNGRAEAAVLRLPAHAGAWPQAACRHHPTISLRPPQALFIIATGDKPSPTLAKPDAYSPELNDFIAKCLSKDPRNRPSSTELFSVPLLPARTMSAPFLTAVSPAPVHQARRGARQGASAESRRAVQGDAGKEATRQGL